MTVEPGPVVLFLGPTGKRYLRMLEAGAQLHTHHGFLEMDAAAEAGFGATIPTHKGTPYTMIKPTIYDLIKGVKRATQIMYPKEIAYTLVKMGIGPGTKVIEAGSGSGGFTVALAYYVGDTGKVYTHERRDDFFKLTGQNLARYGLSHRVEQFQQDIEEGFAVTGADCLFLDVRTPWDYLAHIPKAVIPGAMLGFLLPTTNQVQDLLLGLEQGPFSDVEVLEILIRRYKTVPQRLRPDDRMVAHTGFLIFARCLAEVKAPGVKFKSKDDEETADEGQTESQPTEQDRDESGE